MSPRSILLTAQLLLPFLIHAQVQKRCTETLYLKDFNILLGEGEHRKTSKLNHDYKIKISDRYRAIIRRLDCDSTLFLRLISIKGDTTMSGYYTRVGDFRNDILRIGQYDYSTVYYEMQKNGFWYIYNNNGDTTKVEEWLNGRLLQ